MPKQILPLILLSPLLMLIVACERQAPESTLTAAPGEIVTNQVTRALIDFAPTDALIIVNGTPFTYRDYQRQSQQELALRKASGRLQQLKQFEQITRNMPPMLVQRFISRRVMLDEATAKATKPTREDIEAAEKYIEAICTRLKTTPEAYAQTFPDGEKGVENLMREEATLRALLRDTFADSILFTDEEAQKIFDDIQAGNQQAAATNTLRKAEIDAIHAEMTAGTRRFDPETQTIIPELPDEFTFSFGLREDIQPEPGDEALDVIRPLLRGEWTPVVEQEESFDFYTRIADSEEGPRRYLGISVEKDLGFLTPSIETIKADMTKRRQNALQIPWTQDLIRKAAIIYPNGTAWLEVKQPEKPKRNTTRRNAPASAVPPAAKQTE